MKLIKKIVSKIVPKYIKTQLKNFYILAFEYGQFKTIKRWDCIEKNGKPIPWYTYPAIEYLDTLDFFSKNVFEYGGGSSTVWWAKKSNFVITVEKDPDWYNRIKGRLEIFSNVKLFLHENKEDYVASIIKKGMIFDVIIIDGHWRGECAKIIDERVLNIEDGFIIILDNSDWYPKTAKYIRDKFDLIQVDFHGFGPINGYTWTTTIFFSRNYKIYFFNDLRFSKNAIKQLAQDDICDN